MKYTHIFIIVLLLLFYISGCAPSSEKEYYSLTDTNTISNTNTRKPTITRSKTEKPTRTPTEKKPVEMFTPLPTINPTNIPPIIQTEGGIWAFSGIEIIYLYNLLKEVFTTHNPSLLLDFLEFPLHEVQRCPGDIIEIPEEFIEQFPKITNLVTQKDIHNMKIENTFYNYEGLGFAVASRFDVWFTSYCSDMECTGGHHVVIARFFNYVPYYEVFEGNPTPKPTYDPSQVKFGKYGVTSSYYNYISGGELTRLDDDLSPWKNFSLQYTKTKITMGPYYYLKEDTRKNKNEYDTCVFTQIEVCQDTGYDKWLWAGEYLLGDLLFICDNNSTQHISVFKDNQLGFPIFTSIPYGYLILDLIEEYY